MCSARRIVPCRCASYLEAVGLAIACNLRRRGLHARATYDLAVSALRLLQPFGAGGYGGRGGSNRGKAACGCRFAPLGRRCRAVRRHGVSSRNAQNFEGRSSDGASYKVVLDIGIRRLTNLFLFSFRFRFHFSILMSSLFLIPRFDFGFVIYVDIVIYFDYIYIIYPRSV